MEPQNHSSDESVSSGPCMDFQLSFRNVPNNHETASANSSNVGLGLGLGLGLGAAHAEQDSHPNDSGFRNLAPLEDLSLSLDMRSANPHRINITHHPTLFPYQNWAYHEDQPAAPKFNHTSRKRARDDALTHSTARESSSQPSVCTKGRIGKYGRMKDQSTNVRPLIGLKKNPSDGRPTNSVYDIMFEEVGLPMDPHLRLFFPL